MVDPSYFQMEIGYLFGDTGVAVSWYQSQDFVREGSSGTAIGIGARHTLPKAGAQIYAAVQNYDVEYASGSSADETVAMIGTFVSSSLSGPLPPCTAPSGLGRGPFRPRNGTAVREASSRSGRKNVTEQT